MKISTAILVICLANTLQGQDIDGANILLENRLHNFGDVFESDRKEHAFQIMNSGNEPLVLANVLTSCGCTATQWPKIPVAPGQSATISVLFNSTGKKGNQKKIITILSNAINGREELEIIAHVLPRRSDL